MYPLSDFGVQSQTDILNGIPVEYELYTIAKMCVISSTSMIVQEGA